MSEVDQLHEDDDLDDVEMASIAEEEDFDEMFSNQGTSTVSGKKKIVSIPLGAFVSTQVLNLFSLINRHWKTLSS